ncbi:phage distal tail protein [Paenibacillus rubinfantis]|uniref:phage distal tail protein n=1 Tax=Paenibacillus rubinfantis TaxID=1720296 RepID=UPI00073F2329|nr:phage tail domain-containing protein [Paenibacillus rubinfantis]
MFGGPFTRLPFNRPFSVETVFSVVFESDPGMDTRMNLDMAISASFDMETELAADMTREIRFVTLFEAASDMVVQMIRERLFAAGFHSETELAAKMSLYHVDSIEFTGEFKPGDKIIIDSEKFKITRNGDNVSNLYVGDFFDLNLGTNNLTWTDPATGRTVLIRITHRDKFLY